MAENDEVAVIEIGVEGRPGRLEPEDRQMVLEVIKNFDHVADAVISSREAADRAAAEAEATARPLIEAAVLQARSQAAADAAASAGSGITGAILDANLELQLARPAMSPLTVPLAPEFRAPASTEYATHAAAKLGRPPAKIRFLWVDGLLYQRDATGTALRTADNSKWSPAISITPMHFGAVGDGVADDTVAMQACLDWAGKQANTLASAPSGQRPGVVVDCRNKVFALSVTVPKKGYGPVFLDNFMVKPHPTWVSRWPGAGNRIWPLSKDGAIVVEYGKPLAEGQVHGPNPADYREYPFFRTTPGEGGNLTLRNGLFNGKGADGLPAADFLLAEATASVINCSGIYCANFGLWFAEGNSYVNGNRMQQWDFSNAENGQSAMRTAAAFVCGKGDLNWTNNIGAYCFAPLVCYSTSGAGATQIMADHHFNNARDGDVTTANSPINVLIYNGSYPNFYLCYFDKGEIRAEHAQWQIFSSRYLTGTGTIYNPAYVHFVVTKPGQTLGGFGHVGTKMKGKVTVSDGEEGDEGDEYASPLRPDNIFRVTRLNGWDFAPEQVGLSISVEDSVYHLGSRSPTVIPSTSGTCEVEVTDDGWVADAHGYHSRVFNVSDMMFMAPYVRYAYSISADALDGGAPPDVSLRRLGPGRFELRSPQPRPVEVCVNWSVSLARFVNAAAPSDPTWTPETSGRLLARYTALTPPVVDGSGITRLVDTSGRLGDLVAVSAAANDQPTYVQLTDGKPALKFLGGGKGKLIGTDLIQEPELLIIYLMRVTAGGGAQGDAAFSIGTSASASPSIAAGATAQFQARFDASSPLKNLAGKPPADWVGQWITGVLAITPVGLTHWINGAVYNTTTWATPLAAPLALDGIALGVNRFRANGGVALDFHELSIFENIEARGDAIAHLKRTWGNHVVGW